MRSIKEHVTNGHIMIILQRKEKRERKGRIMEETIGVGIKSQAKVHGKPGSSIIIGD